ncbi:dUTP diphosphatase [Rickettsiales endosymbiont of Trichoplax sp. H2]|uniref:dUTP diphosphatase n=1 Tax=Rickettsiales endosymbiont of Trichoplax sp. H2 TaxID=2021221 RepID=UPI0012B39686|nr:dUTP diphosphatase [Rickettsiales endosymbiont of Trichoplax sp. H2]MSO14130.1 Deoxyuridine 5'-triphosphate nucleotidohydrolase [Rickettsiales endosymbiont of Trichoplax sp. H2]
MNNINICITKLPNYKDLPLPKHATQQSAGVDLVAAIENNISIKPGQIELVPAGISIAIPEGFEGQVRPRSGLSFKHGITVINAPGTIDSDYRGEIKVPLINLGNKNFTIERGMRIAQLVIAKYEKIEWNLVYQLPTNDSRGEAGFGSTGLKSK